MHFAGELACGVGCSDGASRCGLYTAASYAVDKLEHDNEVDVLLTCRYVITGRPTAITSPVSARLQAPR